MNTGLLIIGLVLLFVGMFITAEAQSLTANPSWLTTILGSTLDAIQQTGFWITIIGLFLIIFSLII